MIHLDANESRVLGVLIEKAQTTPQQYPMSVNALASGCNQKSNRDPVTNLSEEEVYEALDSLREKGLVRQVELSGSRVAKFRHVAREGLDVDTNQLVILAELLLRGPQTAGELRARANRMHPIESLDVVQNILQGLMDREEPLLKRLAPAPGSRAERYQQLLCPNLHLAQGESPGRPAVTAQTTASTGQSTAAGSVDPKLTERIERLEREIENLKNNIQRIEAAMSS